MAFKCRNVNPADKDAVLNLLSVDFAEADAPAGIVTLTFSGGAAMRLEVECLESRNCRSRPGLDHGAPAWTPGHTLERDDGVDGSCARRAIDAARTARMTCVHIKPDQDSQCRSVSIPAAPISAQRFAAFLGAKREAAQDVEAAVRAIIADVIGARR